MGIQQPNPAASNDYHDKWARQSGLETVSGGCVLNTRLPCGEPRRSQFHKLAPVLRPGTGLPLRNFDTLRPRAP